MIILGIDPGIERVGYAVINHAGGGETLIDSGLIKTKSGDIHGKRLAGIEAGISSVIHKHSPAFAGVETLYFAQNTKSAISVAQARGVILLTLYKNKIRIIEPTPLQVKMALTGYGRADKRQIEQMVNKLLKIDQKLETDDVYDAAAIAIASISLNVHNNIQISGTL